jgi:chromate transporter
VPSIPTLSPSPLSPRAKPRSPGDLFVSFTGIALQGFGGVVAIIQREIVDRKRWLTPQEFVEEWAVAQIMPGPNVINLALMIGARHFGLRGALAAMAGLITLPLLIVLALGLAYTRYGSHPQLASALRGMGAVAAGMVMATGLKLATALKASPLGLPVCSALGAAAFVAVALLRWPLVYVLLGLGCIGCTLAYRRIKP